MNEAELMKKRAEMVDLLLSVDMPEVNQFFDFDSNEMLDEKIEVLKALLDGKEIKDIPNFHKILELMPKEGIWDL